MAFVDDPTKNSQETPVSGPAPLSNEAPMADTSGQSATPGSNAPTSSTGASINQATSKGGSTNKKAPRASSGAYTNIQKYVEKNQPQAQKMAGAVSKDIGKQAESIRNAVESQKAQKENILQTNAQSIQGATDWAKDLVGNISGTQQPTTQVTPSDQEVATTPEPFQPSEEDITRFQSLMQGNVQGVQAPQDLNIRKDQAQANALQQLAGTADTEAGRRNLLQQTFQKQGDYTRGMSGLDQLITSGDQAAREQLVTGTQGQAQTLQDQLRSALQGYQAQQREQQVQLGGLGERIEGFGTEAVSGIQTATEQELVNRMGDFGTDQQEFEQALARGEVTQEQLQNYLGEGSVQNMLSEARRRQDELSDYLQNTKDFATVDEDSRYLDLVGLNADQVRKDYGDFINQRMSEYDEQNPVYDPNKYYGNVSGSDKYGDSTERSQVYAKAKQDFKDSLANQVRSQKVDEQLILDNLLQAANQGSLQLSGPSALNLSAEDVATPEQVKRYNALQQLIGSSQEWTPEMITEAPEEKGALKTEDYNIYKNLLGL